MKKWFKKATAVVLTVTMILLIGIPAFASTAWDNAWYKPYQATVAFTRNHVEGYGMKWSAAQISNFLSDMCWELEFRPCDTNGEEVAPEEIYNAAAGANLVTTLPNAYKEFDEDDVSIGCKYAINLVAEREYMGTIYLTANSANANTIYRAVVENELGSWVPVYGDGIPLAYVQWDRVLTINDYASWN